MEHIGSPTVDATLLYCMNGSLRHRRVHTSIAFIVRAHIDFRSGNSVVQREYGLSMLNSHPYSHAVYASQRMLPYATQNSLPVLRLTAFRVGVSNPLCEAPFRAHVLTPLQSMDHAAEPYWTIFRFLT